MKAILGRKGQTVTACCLKVLTFLRLEAPERA